MSKEVPWTKILLETFIEEALLTKDEEWVMRTRIAGWSRTQQAEKLKMSISSVDRIIRRLKLKYDACAKYNPLLPPRKYSEAEEWMDQN